MKNLAMIACISEDGGLGRDGQLIWQIKDDMKFFRATTLNSVVVMGRKTYESIGRPLPKRENIVLSHEKLTVEGVQSFTDLSELREYLAGQTKPIYVIGGGTLYRLFLAEAEKLYLTEVQANLPADTYFPQFDKTQYMRKVLRSGVVQKSEVNLSEAERAELLLGEINYEIAEYVRKV